MTGARQKKRFSGTCGFDPEPWRVELRGFLERIGAGGEAEDMVQETFLRALQRPPPGRPRAWLYRVALNVFRDRRRRERTGREALARRPAGEAASPAADHRAEVTSLARLAWAAVRALPERQRLSLYLRIQRHMDYDEIAMALGCSVATARQHFHLGIKGVRNRLGDLGHV